MLKSCSYCGRIHKRSERCPSKPNRKKSFDGLMGEIHRVRTTKRWFKVRDHVRDRDKHLCQICIRKLYNTQKQYTFDDTQVHHVVPMKEDRSKWYDSNNLLLVCRHHHELCEAGKIPRNIQLSIVQEQEMKNNF